MKKLLTLLLAVLTATTCAFSIACNKDPLVIKDNDTFVIVKVETNADLTLIDYVKSLEDYKDSFTVKDGMITGIDGINNTSSSCWMIYTSDEENSNTSWGTVEYDGKVYGSAMFGAETLKVKNGCIYIFVYQEF